MELSPALTEQLSTLTVTLDDPGTDLRQVLDVLTDDLAAAIPSFLGLTMTWRHGDALVTLTDIDAELAQLAGSCIELPIAAIVDGGPGGTVVCYARQPGCFVPLAADSGRVCGPAGRGILDSHLVGAANPIRPAGIAGLGELTTVNRAIGVLISRGESQAGAHAELVRRAAVGRQSVAQVADHVLCSTNSRSPHSPS